MDLQSIVLSALAMLVTGSFVYAQVAPVIQPYKLGIAGIIEGGYHFNPTQRDEDAINFKELEVTLQSKVYPGVDATVVASVHDEDGEYHLGIENAYLSFTGLVDGVGAKVGQQFVQFGKQNALHPDQLPTISRPIVLDHFLGDESLGGSGLSIDYLLPLPLFSQLEVGRFGSTKNGFSTARFWASLPIVDGTEAQWGLSAIDGISDAYGVDVTVHASLGQGQRLTLQGEYIQHRVDPDTPSLTGGYLFGSYAMNKQSEVGARLDWVQQADAEETRVAAIVLTQRWTETYFGRIEYQHDLVSDNPRIVGQIVFNIGNHTHGVQ